MGQLSLTHRSTDFGPAASHEENRRGPSTSKKSCFEVPNTCHSNKHLTPVPIKTSKYKAQAQNVIQSSHIPIDDRPRSLDLTQKTCRFQALTASHPLLVSQKIKILFPSISLSSSLVNLWYFSWSARNSKFWEMLWFAFKSGEPIITCQETTRSTWDK